MPIKVSEADFLDAWTRYQSPVKVAKALGLGLRTVYARRERLEQTLGTAMKTVGDTRRKVGAPREKRVAVEELGEKRHTHLEQVAHSKVQDGTVVIFSDAHYWPGEPSVAHRALVAVIEELQPAMVVANGDLFDGARTSRHPRAGWEQRPSVKEEVEVVCLRMREVEKAAGDAELVRTIGNHDSRFENYISANAPELEGLYGTSLFDYLPRWRACFALHLNPSEDGWTVIRHVHVAGGVHSAYNSTVRAGTHYVHGHLHKLQVTPFGDYRGRRYGVDTGTLAEPHGPQFHYTQAGPLNWCSGFAVLTYRDGRLLQPELVEVIDGVAWFRGEQVATSS
jgi:hypothetical protein